MNWNLNMAINQVLINKTPIIEMKLTQRNCECCNSNDMELAWSSQSVVRRATATWLFPVRVVVCRRCGFCFTSPSPDIKELNSYHADGLSGYKGIGLPYSIENRVSILSRYSSPSGVFVEIGGDRPDEFHNRCAGLFEKMLNVEIAKDVSADYRNVEELPPESVDVLAHYDVLEHVSGVRKFLNACYRALKEQGVMVCEVPDVKLYPRNLLLFEFEHVNHFSVTTLAMMAQACGFYLVETSHICSRPYGFVSVFRKSRPMTNSNPNMPFEYIDTLSCVKGGVEQIERLSLYIRSLQVKITELALHKKKITLWGVTELLRRLLDDYRLPNTAIVVDLDPRRSTHLESEGIPVFLPADYRGHIAQSDLLVIFAPRYKTAILEWVQNEIGKLSNTAEIVVVGSGPNGESLT